MTRPNSQSQIRWILPAPKIGIWRLAMTYTFAWARRSRLEAPIAFLALLRHRPNLSLTDTVLEYKADVTVRRLKALLFEF